VRIPAYKKLVPVRWQEVSEAKLPSFMEAAFPRWVVALNKVQSLGFDLYPRILILILDTDSVIITDLHRIFEEGPTEVTIAAAADQYWTCLHRTRLNTGIVLLRASRYFHTVAIELLYE